ncbi:protein chibby homolog 2 [Chroicocephalus ridibundus]|uniref:protein chibby homolog 2 n=1 Tax=Chroicocephalus ridibundus TaxID=1192867 RepID=UPI002FDD578A
MSAFDLTNQCTEPEIEYITPRVKLRDDMLVFVDGKWVNEICRQPPIASHRKLFSKKAQNEWSIWEENRALWEENQVLRIENRMLWEENKSLQRLQSQNRAVQVIYTDAIQQSLQKENKPFPFFQERNVGFQVSPGNKSLQAVQEKNRVLQDLQQENKRVPNIWKDEKAITVLEERKDASPDLHQDTDTITAVEEGNPGPAPQQEHEAKEKSTTPTQNKIKSAPGMQGEYEIIWALQDLYQLLHIFLKENRLLGEEQGCHILYNVSRSFEEDYNELKLQLNAVKNTVSGIRSQIEMLEKELVAITSPMYEEAGHQLEEI